jgi:hypothetical protein
MDPWNVIKMYDVCMYADFLDNTIRFNPLFCHTWNLFEFSLIKFSKTYPNSDFVFPSGYNQTNFNISSLPANKIIHHVSNGAPSWLVPNIQK